MPDAPLIATLLRRLHLVMRQELLADVRAAGHDDLSLAHIYVFQLPGPDGARPTELAERTNTTKQAMNHLLATLEAGGYLERTSVPHDRRATVIKVTRRGRELERVLRASAARVERDWARLIGADALEDVRSRLQVLDAVVTATPVG